MWSTIQKSFQTFFSYDSNFEFIVGTADAVAETSTATVTTNRPTPDSIITGPPRLPPEIEVQIFEDCARNNRETCLELILVARRVRVWIEPILYEIVILDNYGRRSQASSLTYKPSFELFMANIDSKPPEFYSKHVKNLWISTADDPSAFERILSVCSGVENLLLFSHRRSINLPFIPFLEIPNAGSHLRRLTCKLETLFPPWSTMQNFQHPFFAKLTHLHLYDEEEDWPAYVGFENLLSLTHLAFACCGPEELATVMPKLPAIEYVAICYHKMDECVPAVSRRVPVEVYGIKVVWIDGLSINDWEGGATGRADFWDLVEREVDRRRAEMAT
ncbi:hypothetical protein BJV77DRAFT_1033317 [Russula vinacea]|nr:hypothetical protein BJV77DRAFT_1033317 [Russula vinacea]